MSSDEEKYLTEFGKSLKNFRIKNAQKSLRLLAYETGVPPATLSRLENGQRIANIITLKKLALGFNLNVGEFITKIEKNIPDNTKNFDI